MIPRHRPPFGIGTVLAGVLSATSVSVEQIEEAYAAAFHLYAALLPSARSGICWALRSAGGKETKVVGPAYTCTAVHEAMARSGGALRLVDAEANGFLMDRAGMASEADSNWAVVLSEIYGYSYEPGAGHQGVATQPRLRIFDAAMTVPTAELFARARNADCVVSSFGVGKCIYSGWGGIILSRAKDCIEEIRRQREAHLSKDTVLLLVRRGMEIGLRTLAHTRSLYRFLRRFKRPPLELKTMPSAWGGDADLSREWYVPTSGLDRWLALHNFEHRADFEERRIGLARRYHRNLAGARDVAVPVLPPYAMSHFTIRVPAQYRDGVQEGLRRLGVDAGTLFRCPAYLSAASYPNAKRITAEVLNLPLDASLTDGEIDYVCECVRRCLSLRGSARDEMIPGKQPALQRGV